MVHTENVLSLSLFGILICTPVIQCDSQLVDVFRDDFKTPGFLDPAKWNAVTHASEVNNELEFYTADAVTVEGGFLDIRSSKQQFGGRNYTSGRVDTQNKYDFLYGEIEWRAKVPQGKGIWTALWLSDPRCNASVPCDYWPPSVSVLDVRGDATNKATATVFYRPENGFALLIANAVVAASDLSKDFHIFRLNWTKDLMVFYTDNTEVLRVNDTAKIPHQRLQIVMNVAVGGVFPGAPDSTTVFPADFLIDYVVVRQTRDTVTYSSTTTGSVSSSAAPLMVPMGVVYILLIILAIAADA